MPKVNLYARPNPDGTDADRRVEVGWTPQNGPGGGDVQVGVTHMPPEAAAWRDREYFPDTAPVRPVWQGQFMSMDRDQINNFIRALREARDKAFGRDE